MRSFTELEEINILIYLYVDTVTFPQLRLLNKYNLNLFDKLYQDNNFLQQKLLVRVGLRGDDQTNCLFVLKYFDNGKTLEENCGGQWPLNVIPNMVTLFKNSGLDIAEVANNGRMMLKKRSLFDDKYSLGYWKCVTSNTIKNVRQSREDFIFIRFNNTNLQLKLIAERDCCSISWFEAQDLQCIIGKEIKYIYDSNYTVNLPESNRDRYDSNHLIIIQFIDNSEYQFYLRNSSNGYYDGYLSIEIFNKNRKIEQDTFCSYQEYINK